MVQVIQLHMTMSIGPWNNPHYMGITCIQDHIAAILGT